MKGLLLKEWYLTKSFGKGYLLMVLLFLIVPLFFGDAALFFTIYPSLICGTLPVSLVSLDEQSKWNCFAATLPCTRAQQVHGKYLFGLITGAAVSVLAVLAQGIHRMTRQDFSLLELLPLLFLLLLISMNIPALSLPFLYRFGSTKGRIASMIMVGVLGAGGAMLMFPFSAVDAPFSVPVWIMLAALLLAAGLYALSWRLSVVFYRKKDLS